MKIHVDKLIIGNSPQHIDYAINHDMDIIIFPFENASLMVDEARKKQWEMEIFCLAMAGKSILHGRINSIEVESSFNRIKLITSVGNHIVYYNQLYVGEYSSQISGIDYEILEKICYVADFFEIEEMKDKKNGIKTTVGFPSITSTGFKGLLEKFEFVEVNKKSYIKVLSKINFNVLHNGDNDSNMIRIYLESYLEERYFYKVKLSIFDRIVQEDYKWSLLKQPNISKIDDGIQPGKAFSISSWYYQKMLGMINDRK